MTVIKSKRHESEMEFIHTARELRLYTTRKVTGFPKRYTFTVANPLADSARRIHQYCKMANSVYPLNAHEAQIRRDYLIRANAELQSMVSDIDFAAELFGIQPDTMKFWMDIVDREIRLVKGTMKKDRERYKNLQWSLSPLRLVSECVQCLVVVAAVGQ